MLESEAGDSDERAASRLPSRASIADAAAASHEQHDDEWTGKKSLRNALGRSTNAEPDPSLLRGDSGEPQRRHAGPGLAAAAAQSKAPPAVAHALFYSPAEAGDLRDAIRATFSLVTSSLTNTRSSAS